MKIQYLGAFLSLVPFVSDKMQRQDMNPYGLFYSAKETIIEQPSFK